MSARHRDAAMTVAALGLVLGGAVLLAAVRSAAPRDAPALPDYGPLPEFALTDHHGRPLTLGTLSGSVWIADFIFTRCAGQCPLMSQQMARLQERLRGEAEVQLVSFTVDPDYDTPEVLAAYARHYGAEAGRWLFATGEQADVWALAREGFRLGVSDDGTAQEPITHSVRLALVDRQGHIRGYYDATDPQAMAALREDARRLAGGSG